MSGCVWSAYRLPHTSHGDCDGFRPDLAEALQRLMDYGAKARHIDTEETSS